jgi:uncharacterized membrane protein
MNWRKYDFVEYRKGRYRLERQTWSFWDWCLAIFAVALLWRFWWVFAALASVIGIGAIIVLVMGAALAVVSRKQ